MSLSSVLWVWVLVPHLREFVVELCRSSSISADAAPYMAAGDQQVWTPFPWRLWVPFVTSWGDEGPTMLISLVFFNSVLMAVPHSLLRRFWAGVSFEGLGFWDLAGIIIFFLNYSFLRSMWDYPLLWDSHSWGVRVLGPEIIPPWLPLLSVTVHRTW